MSKRPVLLVPLAVFAVALLLGLIASRLTGPAFDELPRLRAVEQGEQVIRVIAGKGLGALTDNEARAAYASFDGRATPFVLAGAWAKLSLGRIGLLDPLTSARLPWLMLSALAAAALALVLRPSYGWLTALLSASVLVVTPRWLHGVAVTSEGVTLASLFVIVLAAYLRSVGAAGAQRRICWAVAAACALGFGLSLTLAALWVLPLIAAHFVLARSGELKRLLARGRLPAPIALLLSLGLAPLVLLAVNPALWKTNAAAIVRWALAPLAPSVSPTLYAGRVVSSLPVPGGYAASFVLRTLPIALSLAALLGAGWLVHQALARRFASGRLRPRRDRQALGTLLGLGLAGALLGPAFAPDALTHFPPRSELALPFVSVLAAIGLARIATAQRAAIGRAIAIAVVALTALLALRSPSTLGAGFDPLLGGARSVVASGALPAGDGSELGVLVPALDKLGGATLYAPEVPVETWDVLRRFGRAKTPITTTRVRVPGALALVRGAAQGDVVARVDRGGARLWTLVR